MVMFAIVFGTLVLTLVMSFGLGFALRFLSTPRMNSGLWEHAGDVWHSHAIAYGVKKCTQHGWTYFIDDTESDYIQCAFCRKWVFDHDDTQEEFQKLKQQVISWRWAEMARSAEWTADIEREVAEIVARNRGEIHAD